jgi:FAD/FMN-containing dehydrogenase
VLWGELDAEAQHFGLATPGGVVSTTGVAGLTLGGGLGWLARLLGTTCDNLVSADVVLASGDLVRADAERNADLHWGLRGGGGNFGIVTSFELQLHPIGPIVLAGAVFHPFSRANELLRFLRDFLEDAPDELTVITALTSAPPAPFLPSAVHGQLVAAAAVCYAGPMDRGEEIVRPLREFGAPHADVIGPMPYTALQSMFDASYPHGRFNYWKSSYLDELTDAAIDTLLEHAADIRSPLSSFYLEHLGGAIARGGETASAFGHRDHRFDLAILAQAADAEGLGPEIEWARALFAAIQPHAAQAVYVNNLGDEGADRVRAAYRPDVYERLVKLKDAYDPENTFRLNQNIAPTGRLAPV